MLSRHRPRGSVLSKLILSLVLVAGVGAALWYQLVLPRLRPSGYVISGDQAVVEQPTDSLGTPIVHLPSLENSTAPSWTTELVYSTAGHDDLGLGGANFLTAVLADDSTTWIAEGRTLTLLGPDGALIRTVGRRGGGPGEFQFELSSLGLAEDGSIYAFEFNGGRVTRFSPDGQLVSVGTRLVPAIAELESEIVTVLDDGRVLTLPWQSRPNAPGDSFPDGIYHRNKATLRLHDQSGTIVDSLGTWPGLQRDVSNIPIRFGSGLVVDGRKGNMVIGTTDSLDLTLFRGTTRIVRCFGPALARAITKEEILEWKAGVVREMEQEGKFIIELASEFEQRTTMPTVGGVVLDDEGNVWIGEYATPRNAERRWHIFSPNGAPIGQLSLPAMSTSFMPGRIELLDIALGRVALLREQADGELVVEVRRIRRARDR